MTAVAEAENLQKNQNNRVKWVDVAKGLATIFVVFGHNPIAVADGFEWVMKIIWLQMPMFFIVSGFFFRFDLIGSFFRSRFRSLVVPYFFSVLLFLPFQLRHVGSMDVFVDVVVGNVIGVGATLGQPHLWFFPAIFLGGLLLSLVGRVFANPKSGRMSVLNLFVLCFLFLIGAISAGEIGWLFERPGQYAIIALPWSGDLAPMIAGYILLGWLLWPVFVRLERLNPVLIAGVSLLIVGVTFFLVGEFDVYIDMNRRFFSHWWSWLLAAFGVVGWVLLSTVVRGWAGRWLSYVGERSIVVFVFHYFIESRFSLIAGGNLFLLFVVFFISIFTPLLIDLAVRRIALFRFVFYSGSRIRNG